MAGSTSTDSGPSKGDVLRTAADFARGHGFEPIAAGFEALGASAPSTDSDEGAHAAPDGGTA